MIESSTSFFYHVLNAGLTGLVFYLLADGAGYLLLRKIFRLDAAHSAALGLFAGVSVLVCLYSVFYFGGRSTQVVVLVSMLAGWLMNRARTAGDSLPATKSGSGRMAYRVLDVLVILSLVAIRFFQLIDEDFREYNTEFCDHYNYTDNITWLEMYRQENSFFELEPLHFRESHSFMNYHFFEYELGILMKKLFFYNNFIFFEICLLPFLLAISLLSLSRVLSLKYKYNPWFLSLLVLGFFLYHRSFDLHFYLLKPLENFLFLNPLKNFPFYAISDPFFQYPSSFLPKVSVLILGFSGYMGYLYTGQLVFRYLSLGFLMVANISYLPFIMVAEGLVFLANPRKEFGRLLVSLALVAFFLLAIKLLSEGSGKSLPFKIPPLAWDTGIRTNYLKMVREILFVFGNFYPVLFFGSLLFFVIRPGSFPRLGLLILVGIFPFVFILEEVLFRFFVVALVSFMVVYHRKILRQAEQNREVLLISVSFLVCLVLVNISTFFNESFQIGYNVFILMASLFPVLILLQNRIPAGRLTTGILLVFLFFGLRSQFFYFNRIFFPGSSREFARDFFEKAGDRRINSVYYTNFEEIPYFYVSRLGFNLQNYSDSLFTTCVSFHKLSRQDSSTLAKKGVWSLYESFPFMQFSRRMPAGVSREKKMQAFMERNRVRVFFIREGLDAETPRFVLRNTVARLRCRQFGYLAYILKDTPR